MKIACPDCHNETDFLEIGRATVVFPLWLTERGGKIDGEYQPSRIYEESFEYESMECYECGRKLPDALANEIIRLANGG